MAKGEDLSSPVTNTRHRDSLSVVFDKESPPSACARSRSRSSGGSSRSSGSDRHRGRGRYRGRNRSPSSSSSSRSTSRPRSRSYPRCHRPSSRCRCDNHPTYGRNRYRRSPPRRYRPHSRSCSRSPPSNKHSHRRHYRSRSRSQRGVSRYNRADNRFGGKFPRSPSRSHRSRARSRSAESSVSLTVEDKRELLEVARTNAMKILGVERLDIPESVRTILPEQSEKMSPEPETGVRQEPEETPSQCEETDPDASSPKLSPKRKLITFSINNSVAKPTVSAACGAKVTPRVDTYDSRTPYGHWVPVRPGQSSRARKRTLTSH